MTTGDLVRASQLLILHREADRRFEQYVRLVAEDALEVFVDGRNAQQAAERAAALVKVIHHAFEDAGHLIEVVQELALALLVDEQLSQV